MPGRLFPAVVAPPELSGEADVDIPGIPVIPAFDAGAGGVEHPATPSRTSTSAPATAVIPRRRDEDLIMCSSTPSW
jgi:hypothetical protein